MRMKSTEKLYYKDPYLCECSAKILDIKNNTVLLDKTVAFPEGGGQLSDEGWFYLDTKEIPFYNVKKGVGRMLYLDNFPCIQVDTPVFHEVDAQNINYFEIGQIVTIKINVERRMKITVLHSALHLSLMAACEIKEDLVRKIVGCKISDQSARLDFNLLDRLTQEDLEYINHRSNELINNSKPIYTYHHKDENEAWYWQCEDFICPCGGTHVNNTKIIGEISVKRKNVGKTTERIVVTVNNSKLSKESYHI